MEHLENFQLGKELFFSKLNRKALHIQSSILILKSRSNVKIALGRNYSIILPADWVTVTQVDFEVPATYTTILLVFDLEIYLPIILKWPVASNQWSPPGLDYLIVPM